MKFPNGESAQLGDKLERYCLNPFHPKGKDKANLFKKRLGITLENKALLEQALFQAALNENAIIYKIDDYGTHFDIRFWMKTDIGSAQILSCWIIRTSEDFPRLTNAYPIN